ncbi:MAG: decaprenyl-phosphate phosphoribosyltransferase [Chitinispirillales bacterium]|jgi:4-hydroxybenzoate polyprenyltransferase|nr:decaprenyl-phosphate phosphoribosyltransferase [Chitinispirillales bacterium]
MNIIKLLRIEHWTKNLFIFLPVFFGGQLLNISILPLCIFAFFAFSFAASSVYCFNDIYDIETDKSHPSKCKRPVASGQISKKTAYAVMVFCFLLSMFISFIFCEKTVLFILFYCLMNIVYSLKLKQYAIIDVVIISVGFVLRVLVGSVASEIGASDWIIIMTFLLSLFIAFAKRRDDVVLYKNTGVHHRENTSRYNLEFMNQVISIIAAITMVAYIMYTLSPNVIERFGCQYLYFTAIFVLMGIIRYLQVTTVDLKSGNPTKILLRDRFIQCCIIGWIVTFYIIIYFRK